MACTEPCSEVKIIAVRADVLEKRTDRLDASSDFVKSEIVNLRISFAELKGQIAGYAAVGATLGTIVVNLAIAVIRSYLKI